MHNTVERNHVDISTSSKSSYFVADQKTEKSSIEARVLCMATVFVRVCYHCNVTSDALSLSLCCSRLLRIANEAKCFRIRRIKSANKDDESELRYNDVASYINRYHVELVDRRTLLSCCRESWYRCAEIDSKTEDAFLARKRLWKRAFVSPAEVERFRSFESSEMQIDASLDQSAFWGKDLPRMLLKRKGLDELKALAPRVLIALDQLIALTYYGGNTDLVALLLSHLTCAETFSALCFLNGHPVMSRCDHVVRRKASCFRVILSAYCPNPAFKEFQDSVAISLVVHCCLFFMRMIGDRHAAVLIDFVVEFGPVFAFFFGVGLAVNVQECTPEGIPRLIAFGPITDDKVQKSFDFAKSLAIDGLRVPNRCYNCVDASVRDDVRAMIQKTFMK